MVDWVSYRSKNTRAQNDYDDDEGKDLTIEVAENYMRNPRNAIKRRKNSVVKDH